MKDKMRHLNLVTMRPVIKNMKYYLGTEYQRQYTHWVYLACLIFI